MAAAEEHRALELPGLAVELRVPARTVAQALLVSHVLEQAATGPK
jgi:hypothetical protein